MFDQLPGVCFDLIVYRLGAPGFVLSVTSRTTYEVIYALNFGIWFLA